MKRITFGILLGACGSSLLAAGCTAITDLGQYDYSCEAGDTSVQRDLNLAILDIPEIHEGDLLEVRLEDNQRILFARAIVEEAQAEGEVFVMPGALSPGEHRVDFFLDQMPNRVFDAPAGDPAWSAVLCNSGVMDLSIDDLAKVDITDPPDQNVGRPFAMHFNDMGPHTTGVQKLELMVIDGMTNRAVGYYRIPDINDSSFAVIIPGIIRAGRRYAVEYYADLNQNGYYDPPGDDHAWREELVGTATGIQHTFTHNFNFTDVDSFQRAPSRVP